VATTEERFLNQHQILHFGLDAILDLQDSDSELGSRPINSRGHVETLLWKSLAGQGRSKHMILSTDRIP
jgi:hypothetical protein